MGSSKVGQLLLVVSELFDSMAGMFHKPHQIGPQAVPQAKLELVPASERLKLLTALIVVSTADDSMLKCLPDHVILLTEMLKSDMEKRSNMYINT